MVPGVIVTLLLLQGLTQEVHTFQYWGILSRFRYTNILKNNSLFIGSSFGQRYMDITWISECSVCSANNNIHRELYDSRVGDLGISIIVGAK